MNLVSQKSCEIIPQTKKGGLKQQKTPSPLTSEIVLMPSSISELNLSNTSWKELARGNSDDSDDSSTTWNSVNSSFNACKNI